MEKLWMEKKMAEFFISGNFSGFCFDVPENRKNTDIWICQQFRKESRNWKSDIEQLPGRKRFLEAVAAGVLIGILFLTAGLLKREEFSVAISEVTDLYYEARQYPENSGERKKYCATAEKKLQDLSRNYREKEQQRRIELLLAWNAEFLDETEKAALYYENLLLYDAEYRVVYGEYGMVSPSNRAERSQPKAVERLQKERKNRIAGGRRKQESETLGGDQ